VLFRSLKAKCSSCSLALEPGRVCNVMSFEAHLDRIVADVPTMPFVVQEPSDFIKSLPAHSLTESGSVDEFPVGGLQLACANG